MEDLTEVQEQFNSVEGVEANSPHGDKILVKVMEEDAVGRFYGKARRLGVELSSCTRTDLSYTVLDAWASLTGDEE